MPHPTEAVAVRHPLTQQYVALDRAIDYDPQDVLVVAYPWAFASRDETPAGTAVEDGVVTAVAVPKAKQEQVTRRRITRK